MLGVERERLQRRRMRPYVLRPVSGRAVPEKDVLDGRGLAQGVVEDARHVEALAAAEGPGRREDGLRPSIVKTRRDRRRREAGEDRYLNRPDVRARV